MKFSEKIIQARKNKALTQEDLAEEVGVSRQAVSKWETDEAKPDMEKLVAICNVLDLSMDYLCLDKEPAAATPPDPQSEPIKVVRNKHHFWIGLCIGFVAAILIGLLAMALVGKEGEPTQPQTQQPSTVATSPTTTAAPDYSHMLSQVQVADANCEHIGRHTWRVSFVPSIQVPGMQVQFAVINNKIATTIYCQDATETGAGYVLDYKVPDYAYDYDIIAICSIGDISVQFSLVNLESFDGNGMHWKPIWKD